MLNITANLVYDGQCEAAFRFYERCLGGKIAFMMTWGDSPMADQAPPEWRGKILHATLKAGQSVLIGSDVLPGQYERAKGFSLTIGIDNHAEAERIFDALAENGTVQMPIQKTFWAERFGVLIDQFGIPWSINCEGSD